MAMTRASFGRPLGTCVATRRRRCSYLAISCVVVACEPDALYGPEEQRPERPMPMPTRYDPGPGAEAPPVDLPVVPSPCLDGYVWTPYGIPDVGYAARNIWGSGPDDIWVGLTNSGVARYDGAEFRGWDLGDDGDTLNLGGASASDAWIALDDDRVMSFDGFWWSRHLAVDGVFYGFSHDDLWTWRFDRIQHWKDGEFHGDAAWPKPDGGGHRIMWGRSSSELYLVFRKTTEAHAQTHHWDGTNWNDLGTTREFRPGPLTGTDDGRLWTYGGGQDRGLNVLEPGGDWTDTGHDFGHIQTLYGVANDIFVGSRNIVRLFESGEVCTEFEVARSGHIADFWALAPDDVWASARTRAAGAW